MKVFLTICINIYAAGNTVPMVAGEINISLITRQMNMFRGS